MQRAITHIHMSAYYTVRVRLEVVNDEGVPVNGQGEPLTESNSVTKRHVEIDFGAAYNVANSDQTMRTLVDTLIAMQPLLQAQ